MVHNRSNFFYDVGLYYPKAAILSLYFELFPLFLEPCPDSMTKLRMALSIVTAYTVASWITTLGLNTFYCPNVPDNWSQEDGSCSVFNSMLVLQISWVLNFSADICSEYTYRDCYTDTNSPMPVFILPFPLLRVLDLKRGQRYGLILTFTLGAITLAVSLTRFVRIQTKTDWDRIYIWSEVEMAIAIIVVSIPALKYLLRYWKASSSARSESGPSSYYTGNFSTGRYRRNHVSDSLADETGSDVELNRVARDDVILKTEEVSVNSTPGACAGYDHVAERRWAKEIQP